MSQMTGLPHPSQLEIKDFTYILPEHKIARYPLTRRDASKLLIYRSGQIAEDTYAALPHHLPPETMLVFNETKVVHARLFFRKRTGGQIEVFCLEPDTRYPDVTDAMAATGGVYWKCLVGSAAKWKDDQPVHLSVVVPGESGGGTLSATATKVARLADCFLLHIQWQCSPGNRQISFSEFLQLAGQLPIPPYLNRDAEAADEMRYQTVFARHQGSVAAPTAGLHFTQSLLASLRERHIDCAYLTLHVGAGTFKPVKSTSMEGHEMHAEWIDVGLPFIEKLLLQLQKNHPVVAVGTTAARTLESLYWIGCQIVAGTWQADRDVAVSQWLPYGEAASERPNAADALQALVAYLHTRSETRLVTKTKIIIAPGYDYKVITGLITNFHQPQSTLLLLVAALIGSDWKEVYTYALANDFRFLSYGDGCLLWKPAQPTI